MGNGLKAIYALVAVLFLGAAGRGAYLYWDYRSNREKAESVIAAAQKYAAAELLSTYYRDFSLATSIASNLDFAKAFAIRDRNALDAAVKSLLKKNKAAAGSMVSVFTFKESWSLQDSWRLFYASELEDSDKFRLDPLDLPLMERALAFKFPPDAKNPFPCGLCLLTSEDKFVLASFVPLKEKGKADAVLAVSTPFAGALLRQIEFKLKALRTDANKLGLAFYIMQGTKITARSDDLKQSNPAYLTNLTHVIADPFEDHSVFIEANDRLWKNLPMWGPDGQHAMGQIILSLNLKDPDLLDLGIIVPAGVAVVLFLLALFMTFNQAFSGGHSAVDRPGA